jgi:hypothetical protein
MSGRRFRRRWVQQADGTLIEVRPDIVNRERAENRLPQLRSLAELKKRVTGDITKINRRLLRVSRRLLRGAKKHRAIRTPPGMILISLFRKAVNTFEGIELLKKQRLIEESWILLRVLLEAHVNLLYFLSRDPKETVRRYLDASMLDKLKHLREVKFYEGTSLAETIKRDHWEDAERKIKERHAGAEFAALRKHGFTGLSFEQRAAAVGMQRMYTYCYRIASRSVHSFDPAETPVFGVAYRGRRGERYALLRSRREQLEANQNMLLGRLAFFIAEFVDDAFSTSELILVGVGYEKFCDSAVTVERLQRSGDGRDDSGDASGGDFFIWRM